MSASIKLILRTSKINKAGEAPVYLRMTEGGRSTFLSTGVKVPPAYWNEDRQEVRGSHQVADTLNKRLKGVVVDAQHQVLSGATPKKAKQALTGQGGSFLVFAEAYLNELRQAERAWEIKKFETTLRKCRAAWGDSVGWKRLTPQALRELNVYMANKLDNSVNTRRKELSRVRRLVRLAVRRGELSLNDNPFLRFEMEKARKVERRKLSLEEIELLGAVDLEGFAALARDAFLLSFYGGGIRFGDLCVLRRSNLKEGRLVYRAAKTGKPLSIPLPPAGKKIVSKYVDGGEGGDLLLPLLQEGDFASERRLKGRISSRNAQVNTYLKRLAKRAGVGPEGLSMHVARHSFADYARRVSGDIHAIMQALGHNDVRVTQVYLKSLDSDAVDQLAEKMWG